MSGNKLTKEEHEDLFGDRFSDAHAQEAEKRWGQTEAWQDSQKRMSERTKKDWTRIQAEVEESNAAFAVAMDAGLPATSAEAMGTAEQHRLHIQRWFYDITPEFHRNLGEMYVADPRFTKNYEDIRPGMARYVRDAIHANADRAAGAVEQS
jgi:MerR family transcriptional regulator, thiopeptide resistance regulator